MLGNFSIFVLFSRQDMRRLKLILLNASPKIIIITAYFFKITIWKKSSDLRPGILQLKFVGIHSKHRSSIAFIKYELQISHT
jgi:hypothetical protein